jgi:hypothetical protein
MNKKDKAENITRCIIASLKRNCGVELEYYEDEIEEIIVGHLHSDWQELRDLLKKTETKFEFTSPLELRIDGDYACGLAGFDADENLVSFEIVS